MVTLSSLHPSNLYQSVRNLWLPPQESILDAQNNLLEAFVETPLKSRQSTINSVDTLVDDSQPVEGSTVVIAHGYGSGLGFFYNNIDAIYNAEGVGRVVAFDWLGMGASKRPGACRHAPRRPLIHGSRTPEQATDFFVESMEEWRKEMKLEKFTLVGHSLGGYLTARYALKYPQHVESLVLASPVGLHEPIIEDLTVSNKRGNLSWGIRAILKLWEWNFTPQKLVRLMGPRGESMTRNMVGRRFGDRVDGEQKNLMADYLWRISAAPPSGEYALNSLLRVVVGQENAGVYAREPLEKMMRDIKVPAIRVLFGDSDWLHSEQAVDSLRKLRGHGVQAELEILPNAGHHLYLDNSAHFNQAVVRSVHAAAQPIAVSVQ